MKTVCRTGQGRSDSSVVGPCLVLMILANVGYGALNQALVYASDLDVPAYMIYVDPVTGKYTTTPPAEQGEAVNNKGGNNDAYGSANNISTGQPDSAITTNSPPNLRAPATAILLLVGLGLLSLLFKGSQIS